MSFCPLRFLAARPFERGFELAGPRLCFGTGAGICFGATALDLHARRPRHGRARPAREHAIAPRQVPEPGCGQAAISFETCRVWGRSEEAQSIEVPTPSLDGDLPGLPGSGLARRFIDARQAGMDNSDCDGAWRRGPSRSYLPVSGRQVREVPACPRSQCNARTARSRTPSTALLSAARGTARTAVIRSRSRPPVSSLVHLWRQRSTERHHGRSTGASATIVAREDRPLRDQATSRARCAAGSVYRALDPTLDREVAIKVPHPEFQQETRAVERFLREAKAAARLQHPHIVPVYETGTDGDSSYIVSAFISGRSLADVIDDGPAEPRRAARIVAALADALHTAHQQGIIHRDVKPANVLLDDEDRPHLTDFGLARLAEGGARLTPRARSSAPRRTWPQNRPAARATWPTLPAINIAWV